jgi:pimeloyl-ACP methyl ester carboxylesterase
MKVIWGEKDVYIKPEMGAEFAAKTNAELHVLPGLGHYPHLQSPAQTIREVRSIGS